MQMERPSMRWLAAAMAAVYLTACGGGGGDAPGDTGGSGRNASPSPSPGAGAGGGDSPTPPPPSSAPPPSAPPPSGTPPAAPPPGSGTAPIPDPGPGPATPFTLTITSVPQRGLKFEWPAVAGTISYSIARDGDANDGVDLFGFVDNVFAPGTSHTVTDLRLVDALNHKYRVRALQNGPDLATATATVSGDLAGSINAVFDNESLDDSLDNMPRAMATAIRDDEYHVLAVGQPGANGAMGLVRIFERPVRFGGAWTQVANLAKTSGVPQSRDHFGASVSLSPNGLYLAVGIPGDDRATQGMGVNPQLNAGMGAVDQSGAVEVYRRTGTGWVRQAWFKAINAGPDDAFGTAVAISDEGDLVVGAPNEDSPAAGAPFFPEDATAPELRDDRASGLDRGAVYTYANGASGYSFGGFIKPPSALGTTSLHFGAALALGGGAQRLAVGAPHASVDGMFAGGVVLYDVTWTLPPAPYPQTIMSIPTPRGIFGPGSGRASEARENASPSSPAYRGLGGSLSMSQDGLWVAAGYPDRTGLVSGTGVSLPTNGGQVNVYRRQGNAWFLHLDAPLVAPAVAAGDRFGTSLALVNGESGVRLLVGAPGDGSGHNGLMRAAQIEREGFESPSDAGAGYYFEGGPDPAQPLVLKARLKAPDRVLHQMLGQSSAMTSDGNEPLLSGEFKDNPNEPFAKALFFGY